MDVSRVEWVAHPEYEEDGSILVSAIWLEDGDETGVFYIFPKDQKEWRDLMLQMIGAVNICRIDHIEVDEDGDEIPKAVSAPRILH